MAGTRSALIVATYRYDDARLRMLQAPQRDADALAEVLGDPEIGGFDVKTVVNESSHDISLALAEFFAQRRADDVLLVHFSCHGVKDDSGELFLAAADTRMDLLDATAVPSAYVNKVMSRSRSGCVVLLLDCCYAGAFARGMSRSAGDVDVTDRFGGRGRAVITASTALQYAFEGDSPAAPQGVDSPSVFTRALVDGLRSGDADRDSDGIISLDELYAHVHDEVTRVNPDQTPQKWLFDVAGDLYVARRATPVTVPSKLPTELEGTMHSLLAWERVSVVEPLQSLLTGAHPGRALAARLALEDLAEHDDSTRVREAARAALATAQVDGGASSPVDEPVPVQPTTEPADPERTVAIEDSARHAEPDGGQGSSTAVIEKDEGKAASEGSATDGGGTPGRRRWVLPAAAAGVVVVLVGAFLATRSGGGGGGDGGGGGETSFPTSTMLLTVDNKLSSYNVDSGEVSTEPVEQALAPSISSDRQWLTYLEPTGGNPLAPSIPHVAKADFSFDKAVPGVQPGSTCPSTLRATWSPDGNQLAMICKDGPKALGVAVISTGEDRVHYVTKASWVCCGLTWVDNDTVVVGRNTAHDTELVELSISAGTVERTVVPGGHAHNPDWSDQGGLVYVSSAESASQPGQIMVAPPPLGSTDARAWTKPGTLAEFPAWDPSGHTLAYLVTHTTSRAEAAYRMFTATAADEGTPVPNLPTGNIGPPAWGSR
jgi:hypothetical protein